MPVRHPVCAVDAGQHYRVIFLGADWSLSDRRRLMPVGHPVGAVGASQHVLPGWLPFLTLPGLLNRLDVTWAIL